MSYTFLSSQPVLPSLRKATREALERMLSLRFSNDDTATPSTTVSTGEASGNATTPIFVAGEWKVLVYDDVTRDIISPILSVTDLRDLGITVHMSIQQPRQPISDVPAIYFVQPTQGNIQRIVKDIQQNLYDTYYLNFTTALPRALLEELAQGVVQSQSTHLISKVYDQYLDYRVLEENLFSSAVNNVLPQINRGDVSEAEIESLTDRIATSLFGVCATLGTVPYLRFPRGNAAELIAKRLESKLRDSLINSKNSLFQNDAARSVLLLLDRQADYSVMMGHTWIYSGLMHDVLDFKLNRVSFMSMENGKLVKKSFDIGSSDFFWNKYADAPFPDVAEQVDKELNQYKKEAQDLLAVSGASSIEEMQMDVGVNAKHLKSAITQLPLLTAKKRIIDVHMSIATALLAQIKDRSLDQFYEVQQKMTKLNVMELLQQSKFNAMDRLRLFLIYYLSDAFQISDLDEFLSIFKNDSQFDLNAFNYLKRHKKLTSQTVPTKSTPSGEIFGRFTKLTENLTQGHISGAYETLVGGVKQFLGRQSYITRKAEAVLDGIGDDEFLWIDPKLQKNLASNPPRNKLGQVPLILFMVGGGNYVEYHELMSLGRAKKRHISYGTTEILNPTEFIRQITQIENDK